MLEIFNHEVVESPYLYVETPVTLDDRRMWLDQHRAANLPVSSPPRLDEPYECSGTPRSRLIARRAGIDSRAKSASTSPRLRNGAASAGCCYRRCRRGSSARPARAGGEHRFGECAEHRAVRASRVRGGGATPRLDASSARGERSCCSLGFCSSSPPNVILRSEATKDRFRAKACNCLGERAILRRCRSSG